MNNTDNRASLLADYKKYLIAQKKGAGTVKNYTGDLKEYFAWAPIPEESTQYLSSDLALQYKVFLESKGLKPESVRRSFAALNSFALFCISQGWLKSNPIAESNTRRQDDFIRYLTSKGVSQQSARQYALDIKDANSWLQVHTHTHA